MKRLLVLTVGKTHSGKTTFARKLDARLGNVVVVDADNHAEFINTHYKALLPKTGPNTFKNTLTTTIVEYAVKQTELHLILCGANRGRKGRLGLLKQFREWGFATAVVHFNLPDALIAERIAGSERSKGIFRTANSFEEVLARQSAEFVDEGPLEGESDYLFTIRHEDETQAVIEEIVGLIV